MPLTDPESPVTITKREHADLLFVWANYYLDQQRMTITQDIAVRFIAGLQKIASERKPGGCAMQELAAVTNLKRDMIELASMSGIDRRAMACYLQKVEDQWRFGK